MKKPHWLYQDHCFFHDVWNMLSYQWETLFIIEQTLPITKKTSRQIWEVFSLHVFYSLGRKSFLSCFPYVCKPKNRQWFTWISSMLWTINMSCRSSIAPSIQLLKGAALLANSRWSWSIVSSNFSVLCRGWERYIPSLLGQDLTVHTHPPMHKVMPHLFKSNWLYGWLISPPALRVLTQGNRTNCSKDIHIQHVKKSVCLWRITGEIAHYWYFKYFCYCDLLQIN